MKKGQRVYLRHATYADVLGGGRVSDVDKTGFIVTWDGRRDDKGKLVRGGKVHYFASQAAGFSYGKRSLAGED